MQHAEKKPDHAPASHGHSADHGHDHGHHGPSIDDLLENPGNLSDPTILSVLGYREFPADGQPAHAYPGKTMDKFRSELKDVIAKYKANKDRTKKNPLNIDAIEQEIGENLGQPFRVELLNTIVYKGSPVSPRNARIQELLHVRENLLEQRRKEALGVVAGFIEANKWRKLTPEEQEAKKYFKDVKFEDTSKLEEKIFERAEKLKFEIDKFRNEMSIPETIRKLRSAGVTDAEITHKVIAKARQYQREGKEAIVTFNKNRVSGVFDRLKNKLGGETKFEKKIKDMGLTVPEFEQLEYICDQFLTAGLGDAKDLMTEPPENAKDHLQLENSIIRAELIALEHDSDRRHDILSLISKLETFKDLGQEDRPLSANDYYAKNIKEYLTGIGFGIDKIVEIKSLLEAPHHADHGHGHGHGHDTSHGHGSDKHHGNEPAKTENDLDREFFEKIHASLAALEGTKEHALVLGYTLPLEKAYRDATNEKLSLAAHNQAVADVSKWHAMLENFLRERQLEGVLGEFTVAVNRKNLDAQKNSGKPAKTEAVIEEREEVEALISPGEKMFLNDLVNIFNGEQYSTFASEALLNGPEWMYLLSKEYIDRTQGYATMEPERLVSAVRDTADPNQAAARLKLIRKSKAALKLLKSQNVDIHKFATKLPSADDLAMGSRLRSTLAHPPEGSHAPALSSEDVKSLLASFSNWTQAKNDFTLAFFKKQVTKKLGTRAQEIFSLIEKFSALPKPAEANADAPRQMVEAEGKMLMVGDKVPKFLTDRGTGPNKLGIFLMDGKISQLSARGSGEYREVKISVQPNDATQAPMTYLDFRLGFEQGKHAQTEYLLTLFTHNEQPNKEVKDFIIANALIWAKQGPTMSTTETAHIVDELIHLAHAGGIAGVTKDRFPIAGKMPEFIKRLGYNAISYHIFKKPDQLSEKDLAAIAFVDGKFQGALSIDGTTYPFSGEKIIKTIGNHSVVDFFCDNPQTISGRIQLDEGGTVREHRYENNRALRMPIKNIHIQPSEKTPKNIDPNRLRTDAQLWFGFDGTLEGQVSYYGGESFSVAYNSATAESVPEDAGPEAARIARETSIAKLKILRNYHEAGLRIMQEMSDEIDGEINTPYLLDLISDLTELQMVDGKSVWAFGTQNKTVNQLPDYGEAFLQRLVLEGVITPLTDKNKPVSVGALGTGNFTKVPAYRMVLSQLKWHEKLTKLYREHNAVEEPPADPFSFVQTPGIGPEGRTLYHLQLTNLESQDTTIVPFKDILKITAGARQYFNSPDAALNDFLKGKFAEVPFALNSYSLDDMKSFVEFVATKFNTLPDIFNQEKVPASTLKHFWSTFVDMGQKNFGIQIQHAPAEPVPASNDRHPSMEPARVSGILNAADGQLAPVQNSPAEAKRASSILNTVDSELGKVTGAQHTEVARVSSVMNALGTELSGKADTQPAMKSQANELLQDFSAELDAPTPPETRTNVNGLVDEFGAELGTTSTTQVGRELASLENELNSSLRSTDNVDWDDILATYKPQPDTKTPDTEADAGEAPDDEVDWNGLVTRLKKMKKEVVKKPEKWPNAETEFVSDGAIIGKFNSDAGAFVNANNEVIKFTFPFFPRPKIANTPEATTLTYGSDLKITFTKPSSDKEFMHATVEVLGSTLAANSNLLITKWDDLKNLHTRVTDTIETTHASALAITFLESIGATEEPETVTAIDLEPNDINKPHNLGKVAIFDPENGLLHGRKPGLKLDMDIPGFGSPQPLLMKKNVYRLQYPQEIMGHPVYFEIRYNQTTERVEIIHDLGNMRKNQARTEAEIFEIGKEFVDQLKKLVTNEKTATVQEKLRSRLSTTEKTKLTTLVKDLSRAGNLPGTKTREAWLNKLLTSYPYMAKTKDGTLQILGRNFRPLGYLKQAAYNAHLTSLPGYESFLKVLPTAKEYRRFAKRLTPEKATSDLLKQLTPILESFTVIKPRVAKKSLPMAMEAFMLEQAGFNEPADETVENHIYPTLRITAEEINNNPEARSYVTQVLGADAELFLETLPTEEIYEAYDVATETAPTEEAPTAAEPTPPEKVVPAALEASAVESSTETIPSNVLEFLRSFSTDSKNYNRTADLLIANNLPLSKESLATNPLAKSIEEVVTARGLTMDNLRAILPTERQLESRRNEVTKRQAAYDNAMDQYTQIKKSPRWAEFSANPENVGKIKTLATTIERLDPKNATNSPTADLVNGFQRALKSLEKSLK